MLSAALGIISSSTAAITAKTNSIASVRQRPRFKPSFFLSHFLNTLFSRKRMGMFAKNAIAMAMNTGVSSAKKPFTDFITAGKCSSSS